MLSAFYPGYVIGHIPAGIWSDKYGARYVMGIGMALSTLATLLTPVIVVYTPFYVTMIMRNVMGFGQVCYISSSTKFRVVLLPESSKLLINNIEYNIHIIE